MFLLGSSDMGNGLGRGWQVVAEHGVSGEATQGVRRVSGLVWRSPKSWWQAAVVVRARRSGRLLAEEWTPWQGVTRLGS